LAGLVAASRVYVRMHHASDVVAGIAFGLGLGLVARRVIPKP
jgi:undecaprenyl-diphosphatase